MQQQTVVSTSSVKSNQDTTEDVFNEKEEPPSSQHSLNPAVLPGSGILFPSCHHLSEKNLNSDSSQIYHPKMRKFRRVYFPDATDREWNSWQWQVANRVRTLSRLSKILNLSISELKAAEYSGTKLPLGITPYYLGLLDPEDPCQPLRRTVVPTMDEFFSLPGESLDPLGEESHSPVPGLVHRYPDRVLVLASDFCSTHCRYCTRSRMVGKGASPVGKSRLEKIVAYVQSNSQIRDVLISGGDPLTLSDERLSWLLGSFRAIKHVEIIRLGTKVPAVLPQRITPRLVRMLRRYHPLWMSLHFIHPAECTKESYKACQRLADAGIPLGSQTVLLRGINDSVNVMKDLVHEMMKMRVKPYYLYQCDPIIGSGHFRTPVEKGVEIIRGLRGFTSGYAVPTFVIDAPGGGGKIPISPNYLIGTGDNKVMLCNYENKIYYYPNSGDPDIGHIN